LFEIDYFGSLDSALPQEDETKFIVATDFNPASSNESGNSRLDAQC
jgi:hypothetical protein